MDAPGFVTPDAVRVQIRADLEAIDAAHARLRAASTALVGNAFRVEVAQRLEAQDRLNRGLSYRMFGEIADPPDGAEDPALPAGVRVGHLLREKLRITSGEVRRRMLMAGRICPRRSLTRPPLPPELPVLAEAVATGVVGEDHISAVCRALDVLPAVVPADERQRAEEILVAHAAAQDPAFVAVVGRALADSLNPDGIFDERDREIRRGLALGGQGPDGMSRLAGWVTPEGRAYLESVGAAVRPGHHMPDAEAVVDRTVDTRTGAQRLHDAMVWGLRAGIESGRLGTHRGVPVTVIATATVADLEQAARAAADPSLPMPAPARTGGGSALPMRDLIRMAAGSIHYLLVFEDHSHRPIYLGRSKRLATADQRIVCYGRDRGCTRPNCTEPGYHSEVHHAEEWARGGTTDADKLFFCCGCDHKAVTDGACTTVVTDEGRLAWADGTGPPRVNRVHHPDELLGDELLGDGLSGDEEL